jgi:hypothetical protein
MLNAWRNAFRTMNNADIKYYLIPVGYILSVIAMEFFFSILSVGLYLLMLSASVVALIVLIINRTKRPTKLKVTLTGLALIPIIDLTFGITNEVRDGLKGQIVLSVIDDSFASTKALTVRRKGTQLMAEYESSVAGIGDRESADIDVNGDTIAFKLIERNYADVLVLDRNENVMKSKTSNDNFRILVNELIK